MNISVTILKCAKWKCRWQEQLAAANNIPAVLMVDILWGKRESAYGHPTGHCAKYMNPACHDFSRSYFHVYLRQRLVWCPEHRCFEKVHHVEREDSIRSVSGCRMQGNVACFTAHIDISYVESTPGSIHAPIGWILQRNTDGSVDIPPDSNTRGYRKLRAFSHRPEDLHIEYWRKIIGENFDKLFQKTQKNPFLALCKYLKIPATAKLTEGYEKNPFAPLWAIILRRWGYA